MPDASIQWPRDKIEFEECSSLITQCHPRLLGAFGGVDGLNLPVQTSDDQEIENATYNGWVLEHFVSSVLVFSPKGGQSFIFGFRTVLILHCQNQGQSLLPNSMHLAAGMTRVLPNLFMRSYAPKHNQATTWWPTQHFHGAQIRLKAKFVYQSKLASNSLGQELKLMRNWLSIASFYLIGRLRSGACKRCKDPLGECVYHLRLSTQNGRHVC